ncbi:Salicylate hydroxylase [Apiospora kogelbergensis]|uniref:Salicylate hydroxylase n=1 Tax=Apiospora kogelbergensis TaxID=1337665 RepID=UPI00312DAF76
MATQNQTKKSFEIAVIGGGIAGATLAVALIKHGIPCQIYEQGHGFSEIGAGVAFSPNALRAMDICDASLRAAFDKVGTHNQWPQKHDVYFDVLDGMAAGHGDENDKGTPLFTLTNDQGMDAVHRAHFMDEVSQVIPKDRCHFRKHLDRIEETGGANGRVKMFFHDGSTAEADAVVGCDGIKSRTRQIVLGDDHHPSAPPSYTHVYGYRGVIPMEQAVAALGEERAQNSCLWLGKGAHILSYPVDGGKTFNMFGAVVDKGDWPSQTELTLPTTREEALRDYADFGPMVKKQFELVGENIDKWALFDTGDHPVPQFNKGRIVLCGDAAHATTPHHGAGAGFCVEDSAVLSEMLADERVRRPEDLAACFAAFDAVRRPRGHWLVQSSRRMCELYQDRAKDVDQKDVEKMRQEMEERFQKVWKYDLNAAIQEGKEDMHKRLQSGASSS